MSAHPPIQAVLRAVAEADTARRRAFEMARDDGARWLLEWRETGPDGLPRLAFQAASDAAEVDILLAALPDGAMVDGILDLRLTLDGQRDIPVDAWRRGERALPLWPWGHETG